MLHKRVETILKLVFHHRGIPSSGLSISILLWYLKTKNRSLFRVSGGKLFHSVEPK